jgi:hypothetical protein
MAPSTARSSGGSASASSIASGPCCLRPARTWAAATGRGWRPMTRRARPGGGPGRPRPDGSREGRREAQPSSGGGWRSADCGGRGRELAGPEAAGRHARRGGAERPQPEPDWPQQLCLDKGDDDEDGWGAGLERNHVPHIRVIRDPRPLRKRRCKPRRWVVERTLASPSRCRSIPIRWDRQAPNYLGLLKRACALTWYRRLLRLISRREPPARIGPTTHGRIHT